MITAAKGVLSLEFLYLPYLIFFGCGVLTGAVTVVKAIKVCLEKFRPQTIYMILGMMIGPFYAIVMEPTTLEIPQAVLGFGNFHKEWASIGLALVYKKPYPDTCVYGLICYGGKILLFCEKIIYKCPKIWYDKTSAKKHLLMRI